MNIERNFNFLGPSSRQNRTNSERLKRATTTLRSLCFLLNPLCSPQDARRSKARRPCRAELPQKTMKLLRAALLLLHTSLASPFSRVSRRPAHHTRLFSASTDEASKAKRVISWELKGDVASGAVESFLLNWTIDKFGRDHRGPFTRSLGVPMAVFRRYQNGFDVVLQPNDVAREAYRCGTLQVSNRPLDSADTLSVIYEAYAAHESRTEKPKLALLVVDRKTVGPGFAGALGQQMRALCENAEKNFVQGLGKDLEAFCASSNRLSMRKVVHLDMEQAPVTVADVDENAVEVLGEDAASAAKTASDAAAVDVTPLPVGQSPDAGNEDLLDGDLGAASVSAFEDFQHAMKRRRVEQQDGMAFKKALDEEEQDGGKLNELFLKGVQAANAASKDVEARQEAKLLELGEIGKELASIEDFPLSAPEDGIGYDAASARELEGGINIFAGPDAAYTGARRASLPPLPTELKSIEDAPALSGDEATLDNLLASGESSDLASPAEVAKTQREVLEAAAEAVLGPSAGPDAPSPAIAAAAATRLGRIPVLELVQTWPAEQREPFLLDVYRMKDVVSALSAQTDARANSTRASDPVELQAQKQALTATLDANKRLLLSDNYPLMVRALIEGGGLASEADRAALKSLNEYALSLAEQLQEMVRLAEQQQLEKIARLCRVAQEDMEKLPKEVRRMRSLFDSEFIAYLRYAIEKETADIAKQGMNPEREPSEWLQVLNIIRKGVLAERAEDVKGDVEMLQIAMAPNDPKARTHLLRRLIEEKMIPEDLPRVRQTALNMAGNFEIHTTQEKIREALERAEAGEVTEQDDLDTRVLQLGKDIMEILPDERIIAIMEESKKKLLEGGHESSGAIQKSESSPLSTSQRTYVPPTPRVSAESLIASMEEAQEDDYGGFGAPEDDEAERR
eukprot:scaffold1505_cov256-Pinguiococcus_pyrenoidosus.AAC.10